MGARVSAFVDGLIAEEIRRIVAAAIKANDTLCAAEAARLIARTYPNCGYSEFEIANQVMVAAARAGVAVEIGRAKIAARSASNLNSVWPERKAG